MSTAEQSVIAKVRAGAKAIRAVNGGVDVQRRRSLEALRVPQPVCDGAEVALHDAGQELVPVMLRHTAPTVVHDRDKAEQEGGQGAAAAQELQPPGYGAVNNVQVWSV